MSNLSEIQATAFMVRARLQHDLPAGFSITQHDTPHGATLRVSHDASSASRAVVEFTSAGAMVIYGRRKRIARGMQFALKIFQGAKPHVDRAVQELSADVHKRVAASRANEMLDKVAALTNKPNTYQLPVRADRFDDVNVVLTVSIPVARFTDNVFVLKATTGLVGLVELIEAPAVAAATSAAA